RRRPRSRHSNAYTPPAAGRARISRTATTPRPGLQTLTKGPEARLRALATVTCERGGNEIVTESLQEVGRRALYWAHVGVQLTSACQTRQACRCQGARRGFPRIVAARLPRYHSASPS